MMRIKCISCVVENCLRLQMPVDMAMQEPWSGVVGNEAERHIVGSSADADRIPTHWVHEVV